LLLSDYILFKLCSKLCHLEDKDTVIHCFKGEKRKGDKSAKGIREVSKDVKDEGHFHTVMIYTNLEVEGEGRF